MDIISSLARRWFQESQLRRLAAEIRKNYRDKIKAAPTREYRSVLKVKMKAEIANATKIIQDEKKDESPYNLGANR